MPVGREEGEETKITESLCSFLSLWNSCALILGCVRPVAQVWKTCVKQ